MGVREGAEERIASVDGCARDAFEQTRVAGTFADPAGRGGCDVLVVGSAIAIVVESVALSVRGGPEEWIAAVYQGARHAFEESAIACAFANAARSRNRDDVFVDGQIAVVVEAVADLCLAGALHVDGYPQLAEIDTIRAVRPCLDHGESGVVLLKFGQIGAEIGEQEARSPVPGHSDVGGAGVRGGAGGNGSGGPQVDLDGSAPRIGSAPDAFDENVGHDIAGRERVAELAKHAPVLGKVRGCTPR